VKIRAAYGNVTPANLAPFYAKEKGIFLQNGLDVDLSLIDGGGKAMAALLGNSVDIAQLGGTEAMSAFVGGADIVEELAASGELETKLREKLGEGYRETAETRVVDVLQPA
jgi:ABC-type nitrate/sulfonate/bicarbonate transport system substrate-binding protein